MDIRGRQHPYKLENATCLYCNRSLSCWVANLFLGVSRVAMSAGNIDVPPHFSYVFPLLYCW